MEQNKESKTVTISKNAIIYGLAIALVLACAAVVGLAVSREEGHGEQRQESMLDDHNTNPNDGEMQDDQQQALPTTAPTTTSAAPVQ